MGCPFVKSRLHVVETLDASDPDSIQIKAALLWQIKQHEGCQDQPPLEWPGDDEGVPDVSGSHLRPTLAPTFANEVGTFLLLCRNFFEI